MFDSPLSDLARVCRSAILVLGVFVSLAGCGGNPDAGKNSPTANPGTPNARRPATTWKLTDIASEAGIDFTFRNGCEANLATMLETIGGGVAWLDYDNDGRLDLFATGGGTFARAEQQTPRIEGRAAGLFQQQPNGRFASIADDARLSDLSRYTHGSAVADYDNDGFPDLLVTGFGGLQFWHNEGDGTFRERSAAAGLIDSEWSASAGWGDLNGDGALDLIVVHYLKWNWETHRTCGGPSPDRPEVCSPKDFDPVAASLFFSRGDGTFQLATDIGLRPDGKGLGVVLGDIDLDGDVDIYVGNDTVENFLYLNDGQGHFKECGTLAGVDVDEHGTANGSMGVDFGDYNSDGKPDVWVANYVRESFAMYECVGPGLFQHRSQPLGIAGIDGLNVGWGTGFADLDRDGHEDLVTATGHVMLHQEPIRQIPIVLRNQSGRRFDRQRFDAESYFGKPHHGRGLALADFDDDGDLDFAISHNNEPVSLIRNDIESDSRWLRVRLIGRNGNRDAVGAWLVLRTSQAKQLRLIKGGGSYLSHSDQRPFWGVPRDARIEQLEIHWPSGREQVLESPPMNQTLTIVEP